MVQKLKGSAALLAIVSFLALCPYFGIEATQCDAPESDPVRVSLTSRRNHTGHWVSEVVMHHESNRRPVKNNSSGGGSWAVDVEPDAKICGRYDSALDMKLTFTSLPPRPGADYELFPGIGYLKFHSKPQSWAKAREICEQEWAHLAIVNSDKEAEIIAKNLFGRFPKIEGASHQDWAWIGLEKDKPSGEWVTVFGDPIASTGYAKWYSGRPQPGEFNCVLIHKNAGTYHDNPCTVVDAFVCEREL